MDVRVNFLDSGNNVFVSLSHEYMGQNVTGYHDLYLILKEDEVGQLIGYIIEGYLSPMAH